jgi:cobalt transporter subunit CbtA
MTCATQQGSPATEMTMLSRTVYAALVAGAVAGVLLFVLQSWTTLPLIHQAERYERAEAPVHPPSHANEPSDNKLVRAAYTTTGDVLVGIGFGMLLATVYALNGKSGLVPGLLWGLAGFATFHLGPALVVPPSIPALELAPLSIRQAAWLISAFCTGLGLAIFGFEPKAVKIGGLLLLFLPSVIFRLLFPVSGSDIPSPDIYRLEHLDEITYVINYGFIPLVASEARSGQHVHLDRVREDFMSGVRSDVDGTPTFFINGLRDDRFPQHRSSL